MNSIDKFRSKSLLLVLLLFVLIFNAVACDIKVNIPNTQETQAVLPNFEKVKVTWIIDGDTIETEDKRKIRIIGINSPENGEYKEKFGRESTRFAIDTLKNKDVYLEQDISDLDQYGRELRYVWLEIPEEINEESILKYNFSVLSISQGYSTPYIFEPDRKYEDYIIDQATKAREEGIGLWQYGFKGTTRMTDF